MPTVEIPYVGAVEFPDSMSEDDIAKAAQGLHHEAAVVPVQRQRDATVPARSSEELALKRFYTSQNNPIIPIDGVAPPLSEGLLSPLLTLPRVTGQIVRDAADTIGAAGVATMGGGGTVNPEASRNAQALLESPSSVPGPVSQTVAGVVNTAKSVPETVTSPLGLATLATGGAPVWLQRLMAAGFSLDMLRHAPETWQRLGQVWDNGTPQERTEALGDAIVNSGFIVGAGRHAATPARIQIARTLAKEIAEAPMEGPTKLDRSAPSQISNLGSQIPKPGFTTPESLETLRAQVQLTADKDSPKAATHVTTGAPMPEVPEGMVSVELPDKSTLIVNPEKADPETVAAAAVKGEHGKFLGMSTEQKPAGSAVLQTKDAQGAVVQDQVVSRETLPSAEKAGKALALEGTAELKPAEQVIAERQSTTSTESTPKLRPMEQQGDVFANQTEPFNLAGERGTDFDRVAAERRLAEQSAAVRKAFEDKHQQDLLAEQGREAQRAASVAPETITGLDERTGSAMPAEEGSGPSRSAADFISPKGYQRKRTLRADNNRPPDILDVFEEQVGGKIKLSSATDLDPEFKPTGAARKVFARDGAIGLDKAHQIVAEHWGSKWGSDDQFATALNQAAEARKNWRKQFYREEKITAKETGQAKAFSRDAHQPGKSKETLVPDLLQPGDAFEVRGTKVRVKEFEFDDNGDVTAVILDDGEKYGTQRVPAGTALNMDKGTLKQSTASTSSMGPFSLERATLPRQIEGATPAPSTEPVSLAGIREYLSKALDIPVRLGIGSGVRALGVFRPGYETIRMKMLNDVPTLAHEVGHYLHWILFPDSTAAGRKWSKGGPTVAPASDFAKVFDAELIPLGRRTSRGSYTAQQVRWEGFAEFVREWMTDRTAALAKAPLFTQFFERELAGKYPEVWKIVNTGREMVGRYINQPERMKVRSMIALAPEDQSVPLMQRAEKFYTQWVNEVRPVNRALEQLETFGLNPAQARMVTDQMVNHIGGWRGKVEYSLRAKSLDLHGNEVGPSMREILSGVESLDDFREYVVAKRALEKNAQGKETGIKSHSAQESVNALGSRYEPVRRALLQFQRQQRDLLVESGVISKDQARAMDLMNEDYVPFHRVVESLAPGGKGGTGSGFVNLGQGIQKFKGSDRQIVDPLESIVKNAYVFRELAERNQIGNLFVDAVEATRGGGRVAEQIARKIKPVEVKHDEIVRTLENAGISTAGLIPAHVDLTFKIWRAAKSQKPQDGIFTVWNNGKETAYQLGDVELHRALVLADVEGMKIQSALIKHLFVTPTRLLRAGATLTPEFMARNPFRDQITAGVFSKHGFVPFVDGFRGILSALGQDKWYDAWVKSGGRYSDFVAMDRSDLQKTLADVVKEPNALRTALDLANPLNVIQNLRKFSELMEQATRISEFRRAKQDGASDLEAANASKDVTLNFARAGRTGKAVNGLVAFFNASVQDMDKFVRAHRERPLQTTAKALAYITAPSVLLWYLGKDDKEMQSLPDWRKDFFWNVNVRKIASLAGHESGDFVLSFPKPFLLGQIYGSSVERGLDYAHGKDPNAVRKWFSNLLTTTPLSLQNLLPTATRPVIETAANHSFFRGQDLESKAQQNLPAEYRFTPNTSLVARELSKLTPWEMSPVKWDNLIRGYLGGLGKYGTDASDWVLTKTEAMDVPAPPAKSLGERPLLRAFVRTPYEASAWVQRFYDAATAADQRVNALKKSPELMSSDEQKEFFQANKGDLAFYFQQTGGRRQIQNLHAHQDRLSEVNKAMLLVQTSREISPEDKSKRLKELARLRDELAEVGFKQLISPLDQKRHF